MYHILNKKLRQYSGLLSIVLPGHVPSNHACAVSPAEATGSSRGSDCCLCVSVVDAPSSILNVDRGGDHRL